MQVQYRHQNCKFAIIQSTAEFSKLGSAATAQGSVTMLQKIKRSSNCVYLVLLAATAASVVVLFHVVRDQVSRRLQLGSYFVNTQVGL